MSEGGWLRWHVLLLILKREGTWTELLCGRDELRHRIDNRNSSLGNSENEEPVIAFGEGIEIVDRTVGDEAVQGGENIEWSNS